MIYCSICGLANRDGSRFCNYCGRRVDATVTCPACGTPSPAGSRFCSDCGFGLANLPQQPSGRAQREALEGVAFAPLAERLGGPVAVSEREVLPPLEPEPLRFPEPEPDTPLEADAPTLDELIVAPPSADERREPPSSEEPASGILVISAPPSQIELARAPDAFASAESIERVRFADGEATWAELAAAVGWRQRAADRAQ